MGAVQVSLGLPVNDVYGDWTKRRVVNDDGCVLVRPDRIVAWRSMEMSSEPEARLREVMERILKSSQASDVTDPTPLKEAAGVS